MENVVLKAIAFVFIIALGYGLKKAGVFKRADYKMMSRVVLNITLPAAVITSFASFDLDMSLLYLIPIGLVCNLALSAVGYLLAYKKGREAKAFFIFPRQKRTIAAFLIHCTK